MPRKKKEKTAVLQTKKKKKVTEFKLWCIKNQITQRKMAKDTELSVGCVHGMFNHGKANKSVIKLVSLVYKIDEPELKRMLTSIVKR